MSIEKIIINEKECSIIIRKNPFSGVEKIFFGTKDLFLKAMARQSVKQNKSAVIPGYDI